MVFEVTRTSDIYNKREKPCENCFPLELIKTESYYGSDVNVFDEYIRRTGQKKWLDEGTNHRIINNHIMRDMGPVQTWGVRIDTLKELMELKNEVGEELIIGTSTLDWKTPCIEINDELR